MQKLRLKIFKHSKNLIGRNVSMFIGYTLTDLNTVELDWFKSKSLYQNRTSQTT